jgi:hypothetical protein
MSSAEKISSGANSRITTPRPKNVPQVDPPAVPVYIAVNKSTLSERCFSSISISYDGSLPHSSRADIDISENSDSITPEEARQAAPAGRKRGRHIFSNLHAAAAGIESMATDDSQFWVADKPDSPTAQAFSSRVSPGVPPRILARYQPRESPVAVAPETGAPETDGT